MTMCEEKTPVTESMKDYEKELEQSFTKIKEGDFIPELWQVLQIQKSLLILACTVMVSFRFRN